MNWNVILGWAAGLPVWQLVAVSVGIGLSIFVAGWLLAELMVRIVWFWEDRS